MIPQETKDFIQTLFKPNEIIDLRFIESWKENDKSKGELKSNDFVTIEQLISGWDNFCKYALNTNSNFFFGVCPRLGNKGSAFNIPRLRFIWADIDSEKDMEGNVVYGISPERVELIISDLNLPQPTFILNSGHGIHLYWQLDED